MSVDVRALTITSAVVAAVSNAVCAAFVALAPQAATAIGSYIFHLDLNKVGIVVTWENAFIGLASLTAFVVLVSGAWGLIYNRLARG